MAFLSAFVPCWTVAGVLLFSRRVYVYDTLVSNFLLLMDIYADYGNGLNYRLVGNDAKRQLCWVAIVDNRFVCVEAYGVSPNVYHLFVVSADFCLPSLPD